MERDLILDYDIIYGLPGDVNNRIQQLIGKSEGWQPYGLPQIMVLNGYEVVVQSMVKYDG